MVDGDQVKHTRLVSGTCTFTESLFTYVFDVAGGIGQGGDHFPSDVQQFDVRDTHQVG